MAQEIYHRSEWGNPTETWGNVYLNADLTNELYKRASEYENSWVTDQLLNGVGIKPSIILTPTAYEDGVLNSVKPQRTYGSELVTNGDFSDGTNNWTAVSAVISASNNILTVDDSANAGGDSRAVQSFTTNVGFTYKVRFNRISTTSSFYLGIGGGIGYNNIFYANLGTDLGIYERTFIATDTTSTIALITSGTGITKFSEVSVKEVTEADFDFTRGSSATRVNEQGLVEDVQILSGELVQNGDFEQIGTEEVSNGDFEQIGSELVVNGGFDTDSDWIKGAGWTISGGKGVATNTSSYIKQNSVVTNNKIFKVTFDAIVTSGRFRLVTTADGSTYTSYITADGSYTFYMKPTVSINGGFEFVGDSFTGSIDNVSVKEVGQDWSFGTGWSISDGKAVSDGSQTGNSLLQQASILTLNKLYKVSYDLTVDSGTIYVRLGFSGQGDVRTTSGSYTEYVTCSGNTNFDFLATSTYSGSIDNVSVKEVGQNWTLTSGATIEDGQLVLSASANLYQSIPLTVGKKYRVKYEITSIDAGSSGITVYGGSTSGTRREEVGTYTEDIIQSGSGLLFFFTGGGFNSGTIDNVSVVEVTDDTDLPRINYTNFSYEDVLGDELVTNGTFDTDLSGWQVKNSDATHTVTHTSDGARYQSDTTSPILFFETIDIILQGGRKYSLTVEIVNRNSGELKIQGNNINLFYTDNGVFTDVIEPTGDSRISFYRNSANVDITIKSVSVKELTEDVVVPYSGEGSILLEPQSTNLMPYSEDFTQWTNSTTNLDVPSNVTQTNPSGGSESGFININNGVSATKFIYEPISTTSSIHTQSVFFKYHSRQWVQLVSGGTSHYANFDIQNGVVGNVSGCTATIEDYGSGWYKCTATLTSAATPINIAIVVLDDDAISRIPTSTGTGSYYVWGAQAEELSYATSYIPTNGSTVTRLADVCNNSGNSDLINSTEGVLYAEISALADDQTFRLLSLSDGTSNNRVYIGLGNVSNQIIASISSGGTLQALMNNTVTDTTTYNKIALKYKLNDVSLYVNGTEVATDTSATMPTLTSLQFTSGVTSSVFYGNVKCVAVFKEALSDTELEKLTTI